MTADMTQKHALLSASGAHRWLNCPPSARLEEKLPETNSDYANEGKLAHKIAELRLRKFISPMGPKTYAVELKKLQADPLYQDEMLKYVDIYFNHIAKIATGLPSAPYIAIEKRLDYGAYAPEGFGTGDCIMIHSDTLYIIDLKYGKGVPVFAEWNPQMLLYALGAYEAYKLLYSIKNVILIIAQVRLEDGISQWQLSIDELLSWGESIKQIAWQAYNGEGEFHAGEWCRFCRAKAVCRARSETYTALEDFAKKDIKLLSNSEIGELLHKARQLTEWAKDLEQYALTECLAGNEIPGWKVVEGRSNRQFTNIDEAFKLLIDAGFDETILYERKPITLTEVEKLLGKNDFKMLLGKYVEKPPGKPTLVTIDDKRPPISNRPSAQDDFGEVING